MRILLVEDDARLAAQIAGALQASAMVVDVARDGVDGEHLGATEPYDAAVLDLGLPGRDGLEVLERWRAGGVDLPVLILTARDRWREKVVAIDAGADDYLTKPFRMEELVARLRALLRRAAGHASPILRCGPLELDTRSAGVRVNGEEVRLTALEYRLLAYLLHHPGRVISRSELTEHLYAQDFERDSNTVEVFVARIRRKLGVPLIRTVRGLGYRLEDGGGPALPGDGTRSGEGSPAPPAGCEDARRGG